jgi:hypothetical protein
MGLFRRGFIHERLTGKTAKADPVKDRLSLRVSECFFSLPNSQKNTAAAKNIPLKV